MGYDDVRFNRLSDYINKHGGIGISCSENSNNETEYEQEEYEEIILKKADNGVIVEIGCKTLVFLTLKSLFKAIEDYYKDPVKAEKKYIKKNL